MDWGIDKTEVFFCSRVSCCMFNSKELSNVHWGIGSWKESPVTFPWYKSLITPVLDTQKLRVLVSVGTIQAALPPFDIQHDNDNNLLLNLIYYRNFLGCFFPITPFLSFIYTRAGHYFSSSHLYQLPFHRSLSQPLWWIINVFYNNISLNC